MSSILEEGSSFALGAALEANLIEQVKYYGKSPLVKLFDENNMIRVVSGLKISIFNLIAGAQLSSEYIDFKVKQALHPFREYHVPMIWWIGPTTAPADLGTHLENYGLRKFVDMPGMYYEIASLPDQLKLPDNFTYRQVTDHTLLKIWANTQTKAFEASTSVFQLIYDFEHSLGVHPNAPWIRYIGFLNEKPVGVSILFHSAGVAAIFNVATVPKYRRHGIGQLMTKIPLYKARSLGYKFGVLKASQIGEKLYRAMKFKKCCTIGFYYFDPNDH